MPDVILNCIASIALVVLKYPATKPSFAPLAATDDLDIKCFIKVVELGLNKYNYSSLLGVSSITLSIFSYKSSFFLDDCSLKNLLVPNIEESIEASSIKPAELSSSTLGRSVNFSILKCSRNFSVVEY